MNTINLLCPHLDTYVDIEYSHDDEEGYVIIGRILLDGIDLMPVYLWSFVKELEERIEEIERDKHERDAAADKAAEDYYFKEVLHERREAED
jgi:hypothetical protein